MKQDYAHLTGHDVMTYNKQREKKLTKEDIKFSFLLLGIIIAIIV